jgi:hypothetical protein
MTLNASTRAVDAPWDMFCPPFALPEREAGTATSAGITKAVGNAMHTGHIQKWNIDRVVRVSVFALFLQNVAFKTGVHQCLGALDWAPLW